MLPHVAARAWPRLDGNDRALNTVAAGTIVCSGPMSGAFRPQALR
jgi:hypothetical protein